ncbi:MFS transporter [Emticicia sp. BO119]|uniref:MDR family MFS transporter n=1 Tax=Emticicia sp. BO119 TaxID=2757768 RepID=UPI0015F0779A|nr:MFS transporter [Emticicia sp. BO119]MBA4850812.1 MFS transporter [Emticicia sp. BO119]
MISLFRNAFGGLSRQVWLLAIVMFINRSGTMVIAFLTVYLTQKLNFSVREAGIVMTMFGIGSIFGTWMGGKLTDKIGYYPVQFWSLLLGGIMFIVMVHTQHFYLLCIYAFLLSTFGEAYRPANSASIADFSTPETFTRSVSMIRLAINLGWSIGPAIGGFLAARNYDLLFWADGLTNIGAGLFVWTFLRGTRRHKETIATEVVINKRDSALRDRTYMIFIVLASLYAIAFSQLFTIGPLFYKQACNLTEVQIGYLLGLNGLVVAIFEMVFIYKIEGKFKRLSLISFGAFLVIPNYIIFLLTHNYTWLLVGIIFATFSEMFAMPFMNAFSIERAKPHNRGQYSALYAMSWSVAQISAPLIGTQTIALFGFDALWYILGSLGLVATIGFGVLRKKLT